MHELSSTSHGRLLAIGIAIALIGGGIASTMTGIPSIALMGLTILGGAALCIVALALSIEPAPAFTMFAVILLPVALFLYMIGLGVVKAGASRGSYGFIALGALFAALPLSGKLLQRPSAIPTVAPATSGRA